MSTPPRRRRRSPVKATQAVKEPQEPKAAKPATRTEAGEKAEGALERPPP